MKQYLFGTIASLGFAFFAPIAANAVSLGFVPSSQTVPLGNAVSVDIVIDGLGDRSSPSLGVFDFNVNFDASLLSLSQVFFSNQLDLGIFGSISSFSEVDPGIVNISEISLEDASDLINAQPSSFTLVSLTFNTLSLGSSLLTLSPSSGLSTILLGDENGAPIALSSTSTGAITIIPNSTPIPESTNSLGMVLASMLFISYKRAMKA